MCSLFLLISTRHEMLERAGIRGPLLQLFKNYYQNRYTRVKLGHKYSNKMLTNKGTAQGSIIGPNEHVI